jgi:arylsulfatase A
MTPDIGNLIRHTTRPWWSGGPPTLLAALVGACLPVLAGSSFAAAPAAARPNIVLIVVDDLGYGDLGCYGSNVHKTPHLDRLAAEGMRFTDFHANGAVCSPTRAALMTGQYQQRSGIESAIGFTLDEGLPLDETTIAELLAPAGYRCGVFGKWHLGHVTRFGPNDQGFHESVCSNNTPDYHSHISREGQLDWYQDQRLHRESGYLTDLVTQHAVRFIRDNRERPFFAFVSHIAVHFPFQGPRDPAHRTAGRKWHDEKYGPLPRGQYRRAYKDMLEAVDASVGEVVRTLGELGLRERTLIFVTSDNGAYAWVGSNGTFRGEKGNLYEGGHRVPAIASWPGRIPRGVVTDATTMTMDLAPTFLAAAGLAKPDAQFDGVDLGGVLFRGEPLPGRTLFWRTETEKAVRRGPWKLVLARERTELFDLAADPGEMRDLAAAQPAVARELREQLAHWERDVGVSRARRSPTAK